MLMSFLGPLAHLLKGSLNPYRSLIGPLKEPLKEPFKKPLKEPFKEPPKEPFKKSPFQIAPELTALGDRGTTMSWEELESAWLT